MSFITTAYGKNTQLHIFQVPRPHCSLPYLRKLYLSLGTVPLTLCGFYFEQYFSLTGTVVPITEIRNVHVQCFLVRNFEIKEADQRALSYIESSVVFLSFARIFFSQLCLILKLDEKMQRL